MENKKKPCRFYKECPYYRRKECDDNIKDIIYCVHYKNMKKCGKTNYNYDNERENKKAKKQ